VAATVTRINDLLADSTDAHMFATFLYGELDAAAGRFTCTSAGHEPALVVRADGTVAWLAEGGLLLGMLRDQQYAQTSVDLAPGDVLVLYTDGITEAGAPRILPGEAAPEPSDGAPGDAQAGDDELPDDDPEDRRLFGEQRLAETVVAARGRSAVGIREAILVAVQRHLDGRPQGDDLTLVVVKREDGAGPQS
jgi:sigma-B regulation protein RsbU (phosphoserine phosphatase)